MQFPQVKRAGVWLDRYHAITLSKHISYDTANHASFSLSTMSPGVTICFYCLFRSISYGLIADSVARFFLGLFVFSKVPQFNVISCCSRGWGGAALQSRLVILDDWDTAVIQDLSAFSQGSQLLDQI